MIVMKLLAIQVVCAISYLTSLFLTVGMFESSGQIATVIISLLGWAAPICYPIAATLSTFALLRWKRSGCEEYLRDLRGLFICESLHAIFVATVRFGRDDFNNPYLQLYYTRVLIPFICLILVYIGQMHTGWPRIAQTPRRHPTNDSRLT